MSHLPVHFSFHQLRVLAGVVNPCLLLALIGMIGARRAPGGVSRAQFVFRFGLALLLVFILAHINRWGAIWKSHLAFPSGHLSFAAAVSTAICYLERRWIAWLALLLAGYACLIVDLHFHGWLDIAGAAIFAPPLTWRILTRKPSEKESRLTLPPDPPLGAKSTP